MKGIYSCPLVSSLHLIPEESMKDYPTGGHLNSIFADADSTPAASTMLRLSGYAWQAMKKYVSTKVIRNPSK
jgi:hypothetical protein